MPYVPHFLASSLISLYTSAEKSKKQTPRDGASGFIIKYIDNDEEFLYAATARHVVQGGATFIRCTNGRMFDYLQENWYLDAAGPDVAIALLDTAGDPAIIPIPTYVFLSEDEDARRLLLGAGDDVFMAGRYYPAEIHSIKEPTLRFGNISTWPSRPIPHELRSENSPQESFLVEMRSQSGYSGSPVFFVIEPGSPRQVEGWSPDTDTMPFYTIQQPAVGFLGVDWGHLLDEDGRHLMALVVPDHELMDLVRSPVMEEQRNEAREIRKKKKKSSAVMDFQPEQEHFAKKDFESALRKVSRKIAPK